MAPKRRIAALAVFAALICAGAPVLGIAAEQAGVAAAVRGQVQIAERSGAVGRQVASGAPVYLGNAITSGPNSGMQIILLDQTTFTIGPDSQITVDEFIYDPKTSAGKVTATVAKGVFRFVTGKIAKEQPGAVEVKLPAGTIGIRGTVAMGQVGRNANGESFQQAVLLGPGSQTESNNPGGLILKANGQSVDLTRPGWASILLGNGSWGPAFQLSNADLQRLLDLLQSQVRFAQGGATQQDADNAGTPTTDSLRLSAAFEELLGELTAWFAIQDEQSRFGRDKTRKLNGVADGPTTFDQLRVVNTGQFYWTQSGVTLLPLTNTYTVFLNIDFGQHTIGGGNSRVDVKGGSIGGGSIGGGTIPLGSQSYAALIGNASYTVNNTGALSGAACGGTCNTKFLAQFANQGGVTANNLIHSLTIRDVSVINTVGQGGGTVVGRTSGLSP